MEKETMPLHLSVTNQLIEKIENKDYVEKLPSERELCEAYQVSRTTIRHALEALKMSGYITKIQGKGNFISSPHTNKENLFHYYSFTEQTLARHMEPSVSVLGFFREYPNEALRKEMGLVEDEKVIRMHRLRMADKVPMLLEMTYLPESLFTTLTKEEVASAPLYSLFKERYHIRIREVVEEFSSVNLFHPEAKLLGLRENTPCLCITRFSYDGAGRVVELTYSYAHPEQFVYRRRYKV